MKKLFVFLLTLTLSLTVYAQSDADNLFKAGQELQKVMTVDSQNKAIGKFKNAKAIYVSAAKKASCDSQIAICNQNIQKIRDNKGPKGDKKKGKVENKPTPEPEPEPTPVVNTRRDVELSISESRLDFKKKPKNGATQSVKVVCNYDDWRVASKPDWVEVYIAKDKFTVECYENPDDDGRSGIITIKCDDVQCDLIINQDGLKGLGRVLKNLQKKD